MLKRVRVTWLLLSCVFFMLCPKGSRSTDIDDQAKLPNNFGNLENSEPGFDLTEEEMEKHKIWSDGIIPYYIDDFSYDKVLRDRIRSFLDTVNKWTGLHFVELPRPPDDDNIRWVFFVNRRGVQDCVPVVQRNFTLNGVQRIVLGYECLAPGELAEVVLALVGVPPQHNSPDRDDYIAVQKENVLPGKLYLFEALKDNEWLFHDVPYDFSSAGHFLLHEHTVNGQATIKPLVPLDTKVGEAKWFSYNDVWKIRMLYNYILRKKTVPKETCSKLFHPGDGFDPNTAYSSAESMKPRPKPNKYTGYVKEESDEKKNEKKNDFNGDDKDKDGDVNNEDESEAEGDKESQPRNNRLKMKQYMDTKLNMKIDKLSALSDIHTE